MIFSEFQQHDLLLLWPSLGCVALSIWCYVSGKYTPALILLFLGALGLRLFMAHLDPFLWDWDERFHAMVAKNLMHHPLLPTLYDNPDLPYDYTNWTANHIWVHKQPLAMWQMALSYRLFGVSAFTARIPMAIEGAVMVLLIYRIGTLAINKRAGYLSALLYASSFYALDFCTGGQATDHVDYALVFYVSASIWAWMEYRQHLSIKWLILVGICAGLAVLSKWTIGYLIFPAWVIVILFSPEERKTWKPYGHVADAFAISLFIFLPWTLYSFRHYPVETKYELQYNQSHLFTTVDGRAETPYYYLEGLAHNFGGLVPYIIGFGLIFMWRYIVRKDQRIFLFGCMIITYVLFSLIAATKMPAYAYIACVPVTLALGSLALYIQQSVEKRKWSNSKTFVAVALFLVAIFSINIYKIADLHTGYNKNNNYRINKVTYNDNFRRVALTLPKEYVVFGAPPGGWQVEMMYYTGNTCYDRIPDLEKYQQLKAQGMKMAIVKNDKTPEYFLNDKDVIKIDL